MLDKIMESASKLEQNEILELEKFVKTLSDKKSIYNIASDEKRAMLECNRNFVIINSKRGRGKTFSVALKILYEQPKKVRYKCLSKASFKFLSCKISEISKLVDFIDNFEYLNDKIIVNYKNGNTTIIYDYSVRGIISDYLFVDESLPYALDGNFKYVYSFIGEYVNEFTISTSDLKKLFPQCVVIEMDENIFVNPNLKHLK